MAPTQTPPVVSAEDRAVFDRDGVVVLRDVIGPDWLAFVVSALERDIANPGPLATDFGAGGQPEFFSDLYMWTWDEDFRTIAFDSPLAGLAQQMMDSIHVGLFFDHVLIMEPGNTAATPWHQDLPYWPITGHQIVSLWLALDPVDDTNGRVEYVRGSHLWPQRYEPVAFSADSPLADSAGLPTVPDIDADRSAYDIVAFDLHPGDCLVHHALTMHGAPTSQPTSRRRRALATRWTGDDVVYYPHPGCAQIIRAPRLEPGDCLHLDSGLYPRVI